MSGILFQNASVLDSESNTLLPDQFVAGLLDGLAHGVEGPRQASQLILADDFHPVRVILPGDLRGRYAGHDRQHQQTASGERKVSDCHGAEWSFVWTRPDGR